jgi:AcrR family transcriptional regulator
MTSKEKILVALKEILLEKGFSGVSVRSVAKQAGVNHGLVHHYFGSKEKMVVALIDWISNPVAEELAERLDSHTRKGEEPPINVMLSNPDIVKIFWECLSQIKTSPLILEKIQKLLTERREIVQELFSLDHPMDIWILQAAILGMVVFQEIEPDLPVRKGMQRLCSLLGIIPPSPDELKK